MMHIYNDTEQIKGPWDKMFVDFHPVSNSTGEIMYTVDPFNIEAVRFSKYQQSEDGKNL